MRARIVLMELNIKVNAVDIYMLWKNEDMIKTLLFFYLSSRYILVGVLFAIKSELLLYKMVLFYRSIYTVLSSTTMLSIDDLF